MSLNTIVVAVIALIILVVLTVVFAGKFGDFSSGMNKCEENGGKPMYNNAECVNAGGTPKGVYYDRDGNKYPERICCIIEE